MPERDRVRCDVLQFDGARVCDTYERLGDPPHEAIIAARSALQATDLHDSFGCVDLLRRPSGEWVVLEVGTDGLYNHVDRELNNPRLKAELLERIAAAFWHKARK